MRFTRKAVADLVRCWENPNQLLRNVREKRTPAIFLQLRLMCQAFAVFRPRKPLKKAPERLLQRFFDFQVGVTLFTAVGIERDAVSALLRLKAPQD
jgi:hypothetical protein